MILIEGAALSGSDIARPLFSYRTFPAAGTGLQAGRISNNLYIVVLSDIRHHTRSG